MRRRLAAFAACTLVAGAALAPQAARAQSTPELRLHDVIERARCAAPTFHDATLDTETARGELQAGARRLTYGPEFGVSAGPRFLPGQAGSPQADIGVEASLMFGRPGDRTRRIKRARAALTHAQAQTDAANADAIAQALQLYSQAATTRATAALAEQRLELSRRLAEAATARAQAGESGELEAELASLRVEREASEVARQRALAARAEHRLGVALGTSEQAEGGAISDLRVALPTAAELDRVRESLERAETSTPRAQALQARAMELRTRASTSRAERWPGLRLSLGAEREGSEAIAAHLGLGFAFGSGAQRRAESDALLAAAQRAEALHHAELERAQQNTAALLDLLTELHTRHKTWKEELLPRHLALRERYATAYEAGALPLSDVLAIDRELAIAEDARAALLADLLAATTDALELLNFHHPDVPGAEEVICK